MSMILASLLLIQAAPAQNEAEKVEAALKKFGHRTYQVFTDGKKCGTLSLRTSIEREKGQFTAIFDDRFEYVLEGKKGEVVTSEKASIDRLRLLSTTIAEMEGDKKERYSITVEKNSAVVKGLTGMKTEIKVPDTLMGEMSVLRRICVSEQKEGVTFPVALLNAEHERLQLGQEFRCLGKQQVEHAGKMIDAYKWEEKGDLKFSTRDGDPGYSLDVEVDNTYWISPEDYLLKFNWGNFELVLDAK